VVKVRSGSLLRCARSPSNVCVVAEPAEDRKQVFVSAFDPLKGLGSELVRYMPDSTANAWTLDLSPDGTRIAAIGNPEGPIQILSLRGLPTKEIKLKDWKSMHTLNWTADGKAILVSNSIEGGVALLRVDLKGNVQVMLKNGGVNWTCGLESPDGRHLAFQSAPMEGNVWLMEDF
jgi:Tol biopolymer transport system component